MEKIDGFYVDKNGNKWDCNIYTKKQATVHSKVLINCTNCTNCTNCGDCIGFKENPDRYIKKGIAGNYNNTCIYWAKGMHQVVCGCFTGTIDEFKEAVVKKYDADHPYIKYAETAEMLMKMEY